MGFRDEIDLAAAEILDATDGIGESVTYYRSGDPDLTLEVHVERFERDPDEGRMAASAIVSVRDDATEGITSFEVGDTMSVALRADDDTPAVYRITGVVEKTKGFWKLRVEE
jgi:hypothetical protein